MSLLYPHCHQCAHKDTHKETDYPCDTCHGGDECLDERIPELEAKVKALETENAHFRKIVQDILDLHLSAYRNKPAELIADVSEIQGAAKMSLRGPSPA